jgi:membrane protein DedA with SNARE-associated domain
MSLLSLPIAALLVAALIIADFFVPMLPSATVVAALAGFLAGDPLLIAALIAWAASASWFGDLLGYQVLRHTRSRMRTPIFNSAKVIRLEIKLRATLKHRPHWTTIIARFLPAGRTALAWAAVATPDYPHSRTAAVAAGVWACWTAGIGLLVGWVFGAGLLSAATTATAVAALSVVLGWWFTGARSNRQDAAGRPSDRVRRRP